MSSYNHWQLNKDKNNIVWLGLDRQDTSINSVNEQVLDELNSYLHEVSLDNEVQGLILYSLKNKGFIAGADVTLFSKFDSPAQAVDFLTKGQAVYKRLAELKIPSVAMIDGFCMGGGYELALACTYRVASDEKDTKIGLPEVLLGIHPGWGGTVRLPQLIGGFNALTQVMLTGAAIPAAKAKSLGMIDDVVPVRQLKRAALYFIKNRPSPHQPSFLQKLSNQSWARKILAPLIRKNVAKKAREAHYPAPFAIINLWEKEGAEGARAYSQEIDSIENLISENNTSSNLIRVFGLRERLKSFAKKSYFKAKHVHVIGAGVMGGDIAAWCAMRGLRVTLQDQSFDKIAPAISRASQFYKKKLRKPRPIQAALDNLIPDPEGSGVQKADVIIEAVFENLEVKQQIMRQVEKAAKKDAIIATNTSSIPLDEINVVMQNPERLVGIHFFNPVAKMDLVEVVRGNKTSDLVVNASCSFVGQIAKLPLPVRSSPGFLINRVLMPYLMECVELLDEGYSAETIDEAALSFGMFMGPVELADTVGIDVCLAVAENLTTHYGGAVPDTLRKMVNEGKLGRKTGQGFYQYKNGKPVKKQVSHTNDPLLADRLILRMVNESAACLSENVVEDSELLDAGMIFATGFAPFRGGPMHYAKSLGKEKLEHLFHKLEAQYGNSFKIDASL